MKKLFNTLLLVAAAMFAVACGSPAKEQTPEDFIVGFYKTVSNSPDSAFSLTTFSAEEKEMGLIGLKQNQDNYNKLGGLTAVDKVTFYQDTGAYVATLRFGNGRVVTDKGFIVKRNGEWKYTPFRPAK